MSCVGGQAACLLTCCLVCVCLDRGCVSVAAFMGFASKRKVEVAVRGADMDVDEARAAVAAAAEAAAAAAATDDAVEEDTAM